MPPNTRPIDRRRFLSTAAFGGAWAVVSGSRAAQFASGRSVRGWRTDAENKHSAFSVAQWERGDRNEIADLIVDPNRKLQPILGFGAALTESSCYLLSTMAEAKRSRFLEELYSPGAMNLSVARCCIGSSDFALEEYNYDDVPDDRDCRYFSITHDERNILPILREARRIRPDLFLHASPWSPPGWMKLYGTMLGGWMDRDYLGPFATYLLKFLSAYQKAGVTVDAVCTQNEVETDQHNRMPACIWTPQMEAEFICEHFGPQLRANESLAKTQIWLLDYNYSLWKRVDWQLRDARLASLVNGVAFHGYDGQPEQMEELQRRHPSLPIYFTEWSSERSKDPPTDWARWSHDFAAILKNGARNITLWNLLLNEEGKPVLGPYDLSGVVTLNSRTGELERGGQYWALYHHSAHLRRGARLISSEAGDTDFAHIAFLNPDGGLVVVLTNQSKPRDVVVQCKDRFLRLHLPEISVTTLES